MYIILKLYVTFYSFNSKDVDYFIEQLFIAKQIKDWWNRFWPFKLIPF